MFLTESHYSGLTLEFLSPFLFSYTISISFVSLVKNESESYSVVDSITLLFLENPSFFLFSFFVSYHNKTKSSFPIIRF